MSSIAHILSFLLFTISVLGPALVQSANEKVEVSKCSQYKKQQFEEVKTFSPLMLGAEEFKIVVDKCKQFAPFIVGGQPASPKEFPHIARLGIAAANASQITWVCGGTLISERFVLTAAHCLYSSGKVNRVRLGELDFSTRSDDARPEDFIVKRLIPHDDYDGDDSIYNDIALLELDRPVTFDSYKHPACLPTANGEEFERFLAVGWGNVRYAGEESTKLLKVSLNRFSYESCSQFVEDDDDTEKLPNGLNRKSQMCAGSSGIQDTCHGDSGGPLLAYHKDYQCMYTVAGIVSYGVGCGIPNQPGIYTRVFHYIDWIRRIVWP